MKLAYDEYGKGARTVVLLHGFPLGRAMWASVAAQIADCARVIVPDLRGHGDSPAPAGGYDMLDHAWDVAELVDQCGVIDPFVLGGLSMGGYVALAFAERLRERLSGIILCDTKATADTPEAAQGREDLARKIEAAGSTEAVIASFLPKLLAAQAYEDNPALVSGVRGLMERQPVAGVAGCLRGMAARADRTAVLKTFDRPCLLLFGSEDRITPPEEGRKMASVLPDAGLIVIDGAGHLPPLERPDETAAAIRDFVTAL